MPSPLISKLKAIVELNMPNRGPEFGQGGSFGRAVKINWSNLCTRRQPSHSA
jgi:hypothetical protein